MNRQEGKDRLKFKLEFSDEEDQPDIISLPSTDGAIRFEDRYDQLETIGQGAHAVVKVARKRETNELYAVKIMRSGDEEIINTVRRTFSNTRCLRHNNICQDIELYINEKMETAYLIMEYCPFPSLQSILRKTQKITEEETRAIIKQILLAIDHAHSKGISHRDLKPDNILVNIDFDTGKCNTKIVDFGVSRRFITKGQLIDMVTKTGNVFYCAPEIFHKAFYHQEIDIWAIGVIMFQCLTGRLPLYAEDAQEFIALLGEPNRWDFQKYLKDLSIASQNLITCMLEADPQNRITIQEALRHPFFELYNIKDMMALISSQQLSDSSPKCQRCRSLQNSLITGNTWEKLIKTIHQSDHSQTDVIIEDLIKDIDNIHIVQKHGENCNGFIQLMQSLNGSQMILNKLNSKGELLQNSLGGMIGSAESIIKVSYNSGNDLFDDLSKLQTGQDLQHKQNSNFAAQLGGKMECSIDIQDDVVQFNQQQSKILQLNVFDALDIREIDETIEDQ